jgi:fumarate hydratase class II
MGFPREFVESLGEVKRAAADANVALGRLDEERREAIRAAAEEVARGDHNEEFLLTIFQLGSGTNTNTNANEVIANRAAELLDAERGSRVVHSHDHVNMRQSSNGVIPTTIHVAARTAIVTWPECECSPGLRRVRGKNRRIPIDNRKKRPHSV